MLEYNIGILALLTYNLLTAAKGVFLGSFLQKVDPFIVLSVCFALVTLIFTFINIIKGKSPDSVKALPVYKKHWRLIIILNISAVFSWAGYFYALKYIEPAILFSLIEGIGPVITALYYFSRKNNQTSKFEWYSHALTCIILGCLILISFLGLSALGNISNQTVFLGTAGALICGISNVAMAILSKDLNNAGLKARQIIPIRFFLLIALGIIFVPTVQWHGITQGNILIPIITIALIGIATPIYCSQIGIQKTDPIIAALIYASLPIFTLACQFFDNRLTASIYSVIGAFAVALIYMVTLILKSSPQMFIKKPAIEET